MRIAGHSSIKMSSDMYIQVEILCLLRWVVWNYRSQNDTLQFSLHRGGNSCKLV